jgi:hypothetical protein
MDPAVHSGCLRVTLLAPLPSPPRLGSNRVIPAGPALHMQIARGIFQRAFPDDRMGAYADNVHWQGSTYPFHRLLVPCANMIGLLPSLLKCSAYALLVGW